MNRRQVAGAKRTTAIKTATPHFATYPNLPTFTNHQRIRLPAWKDSPSPLPRQRSPLWSEELRRAWVIPRACLGRSSPLLFLQSVITACFHTTALAALPRMATLGVLEGTATQTLRQRWDKTHPRPVRANHLLTGPCLVVRMTEGGVPLVPPTTRFKSMAGTGIRTITDHMSSLCRYPGTCLLWSNVTHHRLENCRLELSWKGRCKCMLPESYSNSIKEKEEKDLFHSSGCLYPCLPGWERCILMTGIERGCSGPCEEVLRRMIKMWPLVPDSKKWE